MITSLHNYQQFLKSWSLLEEAIIVELEVVFAFSQKNKKQKPEKAFDVTETTLSRTSKTLFTKCNIFSDKYTTL